MAKTISKTTKAMKKGRPTRKAASLKRWNCK